MLRKFGTAEPVLDSDGDEPDGEWTEQDAQELQGENER